MTGETQYVSVLQTNYDISEITTTRVAASQILLSRKFGICSSLAFAAIFWLTTANVAHCSHTGDEIGPLGCRSDALITFIVQQQRWPYQHAPFVGYWESFDNKLASIVYEPYSQFTLTASLALLIWFRIVIYLRNKSKFKPRMDVNYGSADI